MTAFSLSTPLTQTAWSTQYVSEYVRASGFLPYMGTGDDAVIKVNKDLTKKAGDKVTIPYFRALSGSGVTGSTALVGSEEDLLDYGMQVQVTQLRNGVLVPESEAFKTDLELANIAKSKLKAWSASKLRDAIVTALGHIPVAVASSPDSLVAYGSATTGQQNAWNAANADRILFGTSTSNASGTHATDLATIAAGEVLSSAVLGRMVDRLQASTSFKVNPINNDATAGREYFVMFVGTAGYNQLAADTDIKAAMNYAWTRDEMKNPIFQGGDLLWNGVIIRKIPEIATVGAVGTASASVSVAYVCGANAINHAWASLPEARTDVTDYQEKKGVAIREVRGTAKATAALTDVGMGTIFYATV